MHSRCLSKLIPWLLPLLVARLCVPAGFMVSATSNGLDFVLCPDYAALPEHAAPHAAHAGHLGTGHVAHAMHDGVAAHHSHGGTPHDGRSTSVCPFVASGKDTIKPDILKIDPAYSLTGSIAPVPGTSAWSSPAVLVNRIRGPPVA